MSQAKGIQYPPPTILSTFTSPLQRNRRHGIQHPQHLIWCHLCTLQTPDLTTLLQSLKSKSQFPALCFINKEDVFLAICITHRGTENV